ncbi:cysteine methyltransferase [Candidatus Pacearchaeota archaeon]|nr:MAG: cysteine methyltransferase [Candidatus Pacearchaeota archaeon]
MTKIDPKKVYMLTKKIPRGKVTTYGEIAKVLGGIKYSRAVGKILNKNFDRHVPCHRVVCFNGKVGGFRKGIQRKIKILKKEGIKIRNGKVLNFDKVLFKFSKKVK